MARNGTGTYTVPNTFVAGTTITASGHNQNWSDVGSEITNSLALDGQSTMSGQVKGTNGTAAAPAYAFGSDLDTGWYRRGVNELGLSTAGVAAAYFNSSQKLFLLGAFDVAGAANFQAGVTVPDASFAIGKLANGTANRLYGTNGSGVSGEITVGTGLSVSAGALTLTPSVPRGYIDGCTLSNGTDTTNDINIAAGVCRDSANTVSIVVAAMSGKQLDANWAAGAAAGMRNSAAGITDTTYHIYAVAKADGTQDIYAHTSTTVATVITALQAESGGTDYLYARRIGSIVRASGAITAFTQRGDIFDINSPVIDSTRTNQGTSAVTIDLTSVPTGVVVEAKLNCSITPGTTGTVVISITALTSADLAPGTGGNALATFNSITNATDTRTFQTRVFTDASRQIRSRWSASGASDVVRIAPTGWIDSRGRDA